MGFGASVTLLLAAATACLAAPPVARSVQQVAQTPITCPIVFDGRIAKNLTLQDFNTDGLTPFQARYVKGQNQTWSQVLLFPDGETSMFDASTNKLVEVTVVDASVFKSSTGDPETGFRRSELLFSGNNGTDASNIGVKTFHWSVKQDSARSMNLSHEYMNIWHETNDYSHTQFSVKSGVVLNATNQAPRTDWKITNWNDSIIWSTPINFTAWNNFAITLDYNKNTLQAYFSTGSSPLRALGPAVSNNNTGGGQFHVGMMKKPTETKTVVYDGFQETGIHEGQIYGGIFVEDSASGCVSGMALPAADDDDDAC